MSTTIKGIVSAMRAWHDGSWDDICDCCGMCCYEREVYENRFNECERCCRLTPRIALFGDHLPLSCAYVRAFRR